MAEKRFSLADQLFNRESVGYLAGLFGRADAAFDQAGFTGSVMARLTEFELKDRISWIAEVLEAHLSPDFETAAGQIRAMLPPPLDPTLSDDDFGQFIFSPLGRYVGRHGCNTAHLSTALSMLHTLTQRFSVEFDIRAFLNTFPDQTLAAMDQWVDDPHYHVRRLVSEGTRPRLPWGQGVNLPLNAPLHLLDRLHADPTRYVTRSVANHMNDVTKKDPDLAMDRLQNWKQSGLQDGKELGWMTGHALRGLVKGGHPRAMQMLGYDPDAPVACQVSVANSNVCIGDVLELSCSVSANRDTPVLVDYVIWFQKSDGSQRPKVFKLKQAVVRKGKPLAITKSHRMKGDATTFRLFPGHHRVELQVNGRVRAQAEFHLSESG